MIFAMLRAMKPLVIVILLVSFVAGPALPYRSWSGTLEAAKKIPPGQLTRKSLVGTVTGIASDGSSITIGTPFGSILVGVTGSTVVSVPPDKDVGIGAVNVGDKVVVKLDRSPLEKVEVTDEEEESTTTDTGAATTTDTGTATTTDTGSTTTDTGTATTTDTGGTTTDTGTATTTDTGSGSTTESGNATTTETGSATTTETGVAIPTEASTDAIAAAIAVFEAPRAGEGLIGLGGYGIGGIALRGVVLQVATTTAITTAATADTGTATTTDTGVATTTDTGVATTTEAEPATAEPERSDSEDLPPFRTVTASLIIVIQAKPTRSHKRAIVTCETEDKLEVVEEDGTVVEFEDDSTSVDQTATSTDTVAAAIASLEAPTAGEGLIAVGGYGIGGILVRGVVLQVATTTISTDGLSCQGSGDDLILLTQKKGRNSKELVVKAKQSSDRIDERLSRIAAKLEESGKADRLERFTARAEERAKKEGDRLQRTLDRSGASRKKDIEAALSKRKELNEKPVKDRRPARDRGRQADETAPGGKKPGDDKKPTVGKKPAGGKKQPAEDKGKKK